MIAGYFGKDLFLVERLLQEATAEVALPVSIHLRLQDGQVRYAPTAIWLLGPVGSFVSCSPNRHALRAACTAVVT